MPGRAPSRPARSLFAFDRRVGVRFVGGADEAGRGALAGPLVVAGVCLDIGALSRRARRALADVNDSKRVPRATRETLAAAIKREARVVVVRAASAATIDRDGLQRTNVRLLEEVVTALWRAGAQHVLVDGRPLGAGAPPHESLIRGDARSACVAAASIVAKTVRDRAMRDGVAGSADPYGFHDHVGYGTRAHRAAIREHGPSSVHRRSFAGVASIEVR